MRLPEERGMENAPTGCCRASRSKPALLLVDPACALPARHRFSIKFSSAGGATAGLLPAADASAWPPPFEPCLPPLLLQGRPQQL